jgi:D-alanyl-D-alanine carboxypeptidase
MGKNLLALLLAALILGGVAIVAQAAEPAAPPDFTEEDLNAKSIRADEPDTLPHAQMLVNPANALPPEFVPENLTSIKGFARANGNILLRSDAAQALREMLSALRAAGITDIYANSGYRNFARQGELHMAKVASYRREGVDETTARAQAARWVLPPGESEHQTGLALDLSTAGLGFDLKEAFAQTAAGRWLTEHCVEYGFILRYTAEKEPLTGVASEPWHFRYVGADHAYYMRQHDLCLEEYHVLLREESPLLFENAGGEWRAVYYATADISGSLPGMLLAVSRACYGSEDHIITVKPPEKPLFDVAGHWGEPFIIRMHGLSVINGYLDGSFRPDAGVSRGEFITALSRLPLAIFIDAPPLTDTTEEQAQWTPLYMLILPYKDADPEKYYYQPLQACYRASLVQVLEIKGANPLLFEADRPLLRGETALLIAQIISVEDFVLPASHSYIDVPPLAGQLFKAVELLTTHGVLSGDGDGLFHPERGVSRAEMSAILCRLLDVALQEEADKKALQTAVIDEEIKISTK